MALPLSGPITSTMILAELGFTSPSDVLRNVIQKPNGRLQVMVNNVWVNLNMCSPYLPSEVSPYIVASDWYGYNHTTAGVTNVSISGNLTVSVGDTITYTATLSGTNFTNAAIAWYKFESDHWSQVGTGSSVAITWATPANAKIKAMVSNSCSGVTVETERNIIWQCTAPTEVNIFGPGSLETGQEATYYVLSHNGSNTAVSIEWFFTGPVTIISGRYSDAIKINCTSTGLVTLRAKVTNHCGYAYSVYQAIYPTTPTVYHNSTALTLNITKIGCPPGTTPETVEVITTDGQFKSTESVAKANELRDAWMAEQAQNGQCFINTPVYNSEYWHGFKQRNDCPPGYTGGWANLTANYGQFTSTINVADANAQRDTWLQAQANSSGVGCFDFGPPPCGLTVNSVTLNVTSGNYVNNYMLPFTAVVNVSATGYYTLEVDYFGVGVSWGQTFTVGNNNFSWNLPLGNLNASIPSGGQYSGKLNGRAYSSCHSLSVETGFIVYTFTP
jgi:hypothetical protein